MECLEVSSSIISPAALAGFLQERYFPADVPGCEIIKSGINDTYLVRASDTRYVFRVYAFGWRTKEAVEEEVRLLLDLTTAGIPVSYPVPDKDGDYLQVLNAPEGQRSGVLFTIAEGSKRPSFDGTLHMQAGGIMGRIHELTKGRVMNRPVYNRESLLMASLRSLAGRLDPACEEMQFMQKAQTHLLQVMNGADETALRTGIVHMDMWFDNFNIDANDNITLFDFDFCGSGWLCLDIAYYILQVRFTEREDAVCREKVQRFLDGYAAVTTISDEERRLTPYLGVVMYFFYLGVQSDRFHNWSNHFLNEAYLKGYINRMVRPYYEKYCMEAGDTV